MLSKLKKVPHLFAKMIVVYCIIGATLASVYAMRAQSNGMNMEGVLVAVLGFFGGELLFLCLKTILKKEGNQDESSSEQ